MSLISFFLTLQLRCDDVDYDDNDDKPPLGSLLSNIPVSTLNLIE